MIQVLKVVSGFLDLQAKVGTPVAFGLIPRCAESAGRLAWAEIAVPLREPSIIQRNE